MKSNFFLIAAFATLISGAHASDNAALNNSALTTAVNNYLVEHGDLCIGKFNWPIDVSAEEFAVPTRDAVQLPVMEKLGLVKSSDAFVLRKQGDAEVKVAVKRYELTAVGKKYYLKKLTVSVAQGIMVTHNGDFCVAQLKLDKIIAWDSPDMHGKSPETTVTYTYKIAAADWTHNPAIEQVFPMVARIAKGESKLQLKQRFRQTGDSWIAVLQPE